MSNTNNGTDSTSSSAIDVTIVGGGMIVHDQILPSLYHLQRLGRVGAIRIVAASSARLRDLVNDRFAEAFPGQSFEAHPALNSDPDDRQPDRYKAVVAAMHPRQLVLIATPDKLHDAMVRFALEHDQHVLCVKPLVQTIAHARVIEDLAKQRGLFVGVEYHKRFDRRALEARVQYRRGRFGQFRVGYSTMIEPYYYRRSNFQNWFTKDQADPFTYVGCHYVDQVYFITGLRPVEVAVRGITGRFPNGNEAWMWSSGQVVYENGGILTCINGLGYPDDAAGPNDQGITMFCDGPDAAGRSAIIRHNDQNRGVDHGYLDNAAGAYYRFINPDYFRLVPWTGEGLRPVGYGYESVEASVLAAADLNARTADLSEADALHKRRELLAAIDARGIIATPANSHINELVVEAARLSLAADGRPIGIAYDPEPRVLA